MAIGVTFPENEDVVTFWWKIERLVRVESKVDIYKKELGNYAGYRLRKVYWKDLHYWGMKISRDAVTHLTKHTSEERRLRLNRAEKNLGCVWNPQIYSECPKAHGTPSLNRWNHSAFKQQIPEQHFSKIWNVISKIKIYRTTSTYTSLLDIF